jgi:hypothetical protein
MHWLLALPTTALVYLPQAELVVLNSMTEFFEGRGEALDVLVYSAEAGSAWSLLYPAYTVATHSPMSCRSPWRPGDGELYEPVDRAEEKGQDHLIAL